MKTIAAFLATAIAAVGGVATTTPAVQSSCVNISRTLQFQSRGADVSALQKMLGLESTGYFGPMTRLKLIDWQIQHKIIASAKSAGAGTTGPKTRAALKCAPATASTSSTQSLQTNILKKVEVTNPAPGLMPAPSNIVPNSGGGGGAAVSSGPTCAAFTTPQPSESQCVAGTWKIIADEAGCPAEWYCDDPSQSE